MKVGFKIVGYKKYWINLISELKIKYPDIIFEEMDKENISEYDVLVSGFLKPEDVKKSQKLKAVFVPFTGINGLPIKELLDRGIIVSNSHTKADTIAEKALGLTLAVLGKVVYYDKKLRKGRWSGFYSEETGQGWNTLYGKKVGIYGMGNIGTNICKLLKPFKCEIYSIKRDKTDKCVDTYVCDLTELAEKVDILYVCVPMTSETKGSVNKEIIEKMTGGYIINVARGKIIDEKALYDGLKNNILEGAGIDTWYLYPRSNKEQFPSKYPIHELKNVVMSPHVAGDSNENRYANANDAKDQLIHYIETNEVKNAVDLSKYL